MWILNASVCCFIHSCRSDGFSYFLCFTVESCWVTIFILCVPFYPHFLVLWWDKKKIILNRKGSQLSGKSLLPLIKVSVLFLVFVCMHVQLICDTWGQFLRFFYSVSCTVGPVWHVWPPFYTLTLTWAPPSSSHCPQVTANGVKGTPTFNTSRSLTKQHCLSLFSELLISPAV